MAAAAALSELEALLGAGGLKSGAAIDPASVRDWSGEAGGTPLAHVAPRSTAELSAVMRICAAHGLPVVPQGGLSGLAGGAVPSDGCVLVSLSKMAEIEEIDLSSGQMTVQAGVPLQTVQERAAAAGMFFALDLGARGSCQIGGAIATNAGGNRVLRYGMMRDLVLGLEVVLMDGTVLPMMNRMPKNNAAMDLKPLFIGSEGTMGIVTRAVLKLHPGVTGANAALLALPDFDAALSLLQMAQRALSSRVSAFELMWNDYYAAAVEHGGLRAPVPAEHPVYVLVEMLGADPEADRPAFEAMLEAAFEEGLILDAVIAQNEREVESFWALRDAISELLVHYKPKISFDVSVPLARLGACVETMRAALEAAFPGLVQLYFGHAGDSNLHLVTGHMDRYGAEEAAVEEIVYGIVRDFGGSVSAEHGIGLHKKRWLSYSRSPGELALLRAMKAVLDPKGLLNPGKVI
ncbi:FAD-binding oxidoreductase [Poseidonocella sp. HB161398]|uniref:FAD-binding oxidoreductase n=1 Tax=Poseidonocella sp. HB161398 TaxID=2320855 RepID=UPI00110902D8|nr:FAD-binding oxidoreductase [Poseidonocella sp. HB161398]